MISRHTVAESECSEMIVSTVPAIRLTSNASSCTAKRDTPPSRVNPNAQSETTIAVSTTTANAGRLAFSPVTVSGPLDMSSPLS